MHDEAQRVERDVPGVVAGVLPAAPLRPGRSRPAATADLQGPRGLAGARSRALPPYRSSPTPALRANTRGSSSFARTTSRAARAAGTCASSRRARTGRTRQAPTMCGYHVVPVLCDAQGNIDVADLEGQGPGPLGGPGGPDGNLSLDPWRLRGRDQGHLRHRPRARWPGVHGRGQHERPGGSHLALAASGPTSAT